MANWQILKAAIADVIKTNGNQEITGQVLQNVLNNIISNLGANATFAGIALPTTNPGSPDGPVFYIASEPGVYSNFNGESLHENEFAVFFTRDNAWSVSKINLLTTCPVYNVSTILNKTFPSRSDARVAAVQEAGIKFSYGVILQYTLENDNFIQEMATVSSVSSSNDTWLDVAMLRGKHGFSFRGRACVNSYNANGQTLSITVDGELYLNYENALYQYQNENPERNNFIDFTVDFVGVMLVYATIDKTSEKFTLGAAAFDRIHKYTSDNTRIVVGNILKNDNEYLVNIPSLNGIIKNRNENSATMRVEFSEIIQKRLIDTFSVNDDQPSWEVVTVDGQEYIEVTYKAGVNQSIQITNKIKGFFVVSVVIEPTSVPVQVGTFSVNFKPSDQRIIEAGEEGGTYSLFFQNSDVINVGILGKDHPDEDITLRFRISIRECQYDIIGNDDEIRDTFGRSNILSYTIGGAGIELQNKGNGSVVIKTTSIETGFIDSGIDTGFKPYWLKIKARCNNGGQILRVGQISSSDKADASDIVLTTEFKEFSLKFKGIDAITSKSSYSIGISVLQSRAAIGNEFEIEYVQISQYGTVEYAFLEIVGNDTNSVNHLPITANTDAFLNSVSRKGKYLIKIACEGDSLIANEIGGSIPAEYDEGETKRPIRLRSNGVPRRLYDFISWNKPQWRRLDNSEWVNSGFVEFSEGGLFEGTTDKYWKSTGAGNYIEIEVPDGMENFAIVLRTKQGNGKLDVSLNGGSIGTYTNPYWTEKVDTNTVVNSERVPHYIDRGLSQIDTNVGISSTGNPYAVFEYNNLPAGNNTLRFTAADGTRVDVWGGFYWSGNTCVVMNIAHGGHTTKDLINQHLDDELYNADYDSVLFEITEMNNSRLSLSQTQGDLIRIISKIRELGLDHCYTSCNPFGLSITHDVNFYTMYNSPSQLEINDTVRKIMNTLNEPFIDIFQYFRWNIENRGGTLEGGEGGLWYTHDGQHGNESGVKLWFDSIKKVIMGKLIMQD